MRVPIALSILLAAAVVASADKPTVVKLESPPPAEWQVIQADPVQTTLSAGVSAKWVLVDDGPGVDLRPSTDGKTANFATTADGHFRVLVIAGEDVHRLKVVRVTKPPQPMPPGPDPQPQPPSDPLVKVLQAGYDADTRAADAKRNDLLDLIELYKQAGALANDASILTAADLVKRVKDAAAKIGVTGLGDVRKAITAELSAVFPEDVTLTAENRKKASELFGRIKSSLGQVK